jgi:hypothetical protein
MLHFFCSRLIALDPATSVNTVRYSFSQKTVLNLTYLTPLLHLSPEGHAPFLTVKVTCVQSKILEKHKERRHWLQNTIPKDDHSSYQ